MSAPNLSLLQGQASPSVSQQSSESNSSSSAYSVRILAFGDSLTAGYHNFGLAFHPYALRLQALLNQHEFQQQNQTADKDGDSTPASSEPSSCPPSHSKPVLESGRISYNIDERGVSGETTQEMLVSSRLPLILSSAIAENRPYSIVIILAGTNDLGTVAAAAINSNLERMHQLCLDHSPTTRTIAMSIPEVNSKFKVPVWLTERRDAVNRFLKDWSGNVNLHGRVGFLDLQNQIKFNSSGEPQNFYDDTLHFTPAGYDRMAELIFEKLKQLHWLPSPQVRTPTATLSIRSNGTANAATPAPISSFKSDTSCTLPILAFGASLTAGYYNRGLSFHPYTIRLKTLLEDHERARGTSNSNSSSSTSSSSPDSFNVSSSFRKYIIAQHGIPGETTGNMLPRRLPRLLQAAARDGVPYWLVVILAGTNDVFSDVPVDLITDNLRKMYQQCLDHSPHTKVLAVSLPDTDPKFTPDFYKESKDQVNQWMNDWANTGGGVERLNGRARVGFVDLRPHIKFSSNDSDAKLYYDDELHFTPAGYNRMGELVFNKILELGWL